MTDPEYLQRETVKLLRQLAEDLETGRITVLNVKIDDTWRDDPIRGQFHKILIGRTRLIFAAIAPRLSDG